MPQAPQLFKYTRLLEEDIHYTDITPAQARDVDRFAKDIQRWQKHKKKMIVGYVGAFGSGKSLVLSRVSDIIRAKNPDTLWIDFDSWRFADRTQLWDGFVIEVFKSVKKTHSTEKVIDAISGIRGVRRWVNNHRIFAAAAAFGLWLLLCRILWGALHGNTHDSAFFYTAVLKYATSSFFAVLVLFGVSEIFRQQRPIGRAIELENMLKKALKSANGSVVVVAEDIDRAGEEGVIFLETLRNFLNNLPGTKQTPSLIVIAPQDVTYFSALNDDKIKGLSRSVKIYSSVRYSGSSTFDLAEIPPFLVAAGARKDQEGRLYLVLESIYRGRTGQLSWRQLKFMLRELNEFIKANPEADPAVSLVFIASRYIKDNTNNADNLLLRSISSAIGRNLSSFGTDTRAAREVYKLIVILEQGSAPDGLWYYMQFSESENEMIIEDHLDVNGHIDGKSISLNKRYLNLMA